MNHFNNSPEAAFRRLIRQVIRKCPDFTRAEKDVTTALVNLWFHHRHGPKGYIHPGRRLLAKRSGCTEKTVMRTLKKLRAIGAITAISDLKGGRDATRYTVDLNVILTFCGCDWLDDIVRKCPGKTARLVAVSGTQNVPDRGGQNVPLYSNVRTSPSQVDEDRC